MKDYYYILGIKKDATSQEVKKAYKKLSLKFHPDQNGGDDFFTDRFKEIQEAYETLSDTNKKLIYDRNFKQNSNTDTKHGFNNFLPVVEYFKSDFKNVEYGKEITLSWKCLNADKVEINKIGTVPAIGSKRIRIKNFDSAFIKVQLSATNNYIGKKTTSSIQLKNITYQNLKNKILREIKEEERVNNTQQKRNQYNTKAQEQDKNEHNPKKLGFTDFIVGIIFFIGVIFILSIILYKP